MKEFNTMGTITFDFDIDVEASNEKEAQEKAVQIIKDYYRLNIRNGTYHVDESVKITDLDTGEYD